jgi:Streptomycin adenylyltransferase.
MLNIRNRIISLINDTLVNDSRVYALWLEGSDGLGRTDAYSDIDIWIDAEDKYEMQVLDKCMHTLQTISEFDFVDCFNHPHPKIFQRNMHLKDTSEYLIIDICVQSHSRGSEGCTFVKGDIAESPLILFDKSSVVKIIEPSRLDIESILGICERCRTVYSQRSRLAKYILRNQHLEAYAYYDKYVRQPLICLYRLIYTPTHSEYSLIHISSHLPEDIVKQLEVLYKADSIENIKNNILIADRLYENVGEQISKLYVM